MANDFILLEVTGIRELQAKLKALPPEYQDAITDDVLAYLKEVFVKYPSYKYVARRTAYPEVGGWFSEKQRKFVMASIRQGTIKIPYRRSQTLSRGWKVHGRGRSSFLANETGYAHLVMGDNTQERGARARGWSMISQIISDRMPRIIEKADAALKKAIKRLGL